MYKVEKQKAGAAFYNAEKVRKKNNKAINKLLKINSNLENASDSTSRYQNRKRLEKDERAFFKECEKRLYKLNLEFDIWADEEQKLDSLCKRRAMLFEVLKTTNEQLIEEPMMKSLNHGAQQRQERLLILNKDLRKNVGVLSRQLVQQTKLFEEFTEKERENKEMMVIQDNYFREIRQKLKMYNLVTVKKKFSSDDESRMEAIRKNQKLDCMLKSLSQQTINVPMLKYQFLCAVDEKRRLNVLNGELELEILVLSERLSEQTGWEVSFEELERKVQSLQQTQAARLKKIEELKFNTKLGTKSMFSSFSAEKRDRDKLTRRLNYFRAKVTSLQKEYKTFQPDIEGYMKELQAASEATESPRNVAGNSPKSRKSGDSSSDSPSDSDYDDTEESFVSTHPIQNRKPTGMFPIAWYNLENESRSSSEATAEDRPGNKTSAEDSSESDSQLRQRAVIPRLIGKRPSSKADSAYSSNECRCDPVLSSRRMTRTPPSHRPSWWSFLF